MRRLPTPTLEQELRALADRLDQEAQMAGLMERYRVALEEGEAERRQADVQRLGREAAQRKWDAEEEEEAQVWRDLEQLYARRR